MIFVNFRDCFSLMAHFLFLLPVDAVVSPAAVGDVFPQTQVRAAVDSFKSYYSNFKRLAHPTKCS